MLDGNAIPYDTRSALHFSFPVIGQDVFYRGKRAYVLGLFRVPLQYGCGTVAAMDARKKNHIRDRRMIRNVKHELKNGPGRSQTSHDADEARRVRPGDTVSVDFFAWTEDGAMIECSLFDQPVTFTTGQHAVMKCLDELVIGMRVGESKTERIPPEQAFGPYRDELSCQVSTTWLRAQQVSPSPGSVLEIRKTNGMVIHMTITDVDGDRVTLDANHRLAGIPIILQLELLGIQDPAEIDLSWKDRSTL